MPRSEPSRLNLTLGIIFAVGGMLTLWTGRLQSATIAEFRVSALPARVIASLFLIMGLMLLFGYLRSRRRSDG